jgi:hypothetical protein
MIMSLTGLCVTHDSAGQIIVKVIEDDDVSDVEHVGDARVHNVL